MWNELAVHELGIFVANKLASRLNPSQDQDKSVSCLSCSMARLLIFFSLEYVK